MHDALKQLLKKYHCRSERDYINALKEIFQEIALLGLSRAKFFEKAAFYGGSALRILYGLERFSEDLDFSLLKNDKNFKLDVYNKAIASELAAFGVDAMVDTKLKQTQSNIASAFIKTESKKQLITIEAPANIIKKIHAMQNIKIKMEVDINPPGLFTTETKFLLHPIPFSVKSFSKSDLFAGKLHAILCRPWVKRIKGRDWYDFVWYVSQDIPVNLNHLRERLVQSDAWDRKKVFAKNDLLLLLRNKIRSVDFESAKTDIIQFINNIDSISVWSPEFFLAVSEKLRVVNK